jgi:V/A-type H+-transporting ATPase subunit G/H
MVDESLKRLLDAEANAELVIARAEAERQQIIEQAKLEVQALERQHADRVREIHATFLNQAGQRAQQTIAELKRRNVDHASAMRHAAKESESRALDAAMTLLTEGGISRP